MRLNAYVLLSDPTWLVRSVLSYYDHVDKIVASYDENGRSWTGEDRRDRMMWCVDRIRIIDHANKVVLAPGDFAEPGETSQRRDAAALAADGADWVLQIDTDEQLPRPTALLDVLRETDADAVEWPMRVLYRRLTQHRYLEVRSADGGPHYDYPGPIALRAGVLPEKARHVPSRATIRAAVDGVDEPTQPAVDTALVPISAADAIIHNSWGRRPASVLAKVRGWSHADEINGTRYFASRWLPSPVLWPVMRDFHPLHGPWWPRLGVTRVPWTSA